MFCRIGFRRASSALFLAAAGWIAAACNSSNPVAPDPPPPTGNSLFTITLTANPATLATGSNTPSAISIAVRRNDNGQPPPDGTNVAINTSLGNFGTDTSGNAVTITSVRLAGGNGQVNLFAGPANGTAQVLAQVEQSTGQVAIPIRTETPPPFFLTSISPNSGFHLGGQTVTISGSGIQAPVRVTFGGVVAQVRATTATTIQATVPASTTPVEAGMTKAVDVEVTNALGQSNSTSDKLASAWTYRGENVDPPLAIFSVSPLSGPNEGGTMVTITGQSFKPPVQVVFGKTMGGAFQGFQATVKTNPAPTDATIVAVTPSATGVGLSLANQLVDVQVRNVNTGESTIATGVFSYTGASLIVTSMSPLTGPYTGGTPVVIRGSGFDPRGTYQVQFGGTVQNFQPPPAQGGTVLNVTTVPVSVSNCNPPSGPLTVTRLDTGESVQSALRFSYTVPTPNVTSLSPASGAQGGGTVVNIQGSGFDSQVRVTFNGAVAVVGSTGSTSVSATTPAFTGTFDTETCTDGMGGQGKRNKPKAVDVVVTNTATGCADTFPQGFTYQPNDTSCVVPPPAKPKADFTFQVSPTDTTVQFNNASTNSPTSYLWDFGEPSSGGANTSFATNPSHVYSVPSGMTKTFSVTLTASNAGGSDTVVKLVSVKAP